MIIEIIWIEWNRHMKMIKCQYFENIKMTLNFDVDAEEDEIWRFLFEKIDFSCFSKLHFQSRYPQHPVSTIIKVSWEIYWSGVHTIKNSTQIKCWTLDNYFKGCKCQFRHKNLDITETFWSRYRTCWVYLKSCE